MEDYLSHCKKCGNAKLRSELQLSCDCYGIPYRYVCEDCRKEIAEIGYDGAYYDGQDEYMGNDY